MITGSEGLRTGGAGQVGSVESIPVQSARTGRRPPHGHDRPHRRPGQLGSQRQPGLAVARASPAPQVMRRLPVDLAECRDLDYRLGTGMPVHLFDRDEAQVLGGEGW